MEKLSKQVVREICAKKHDCSCCTAAFLCGFILAGGEFKILNKKPCIVLKTINKDCLPTVEHIIKEQYGAVKIAGGIVDENTSAKILQDCDMLTLGNFVPRVSDQIFACEGCAAAFVRGVFLSTGRDNIKLGGILQQSSGSGYKVIFNVGGGSVNEALTQILIEQDIDVNVVSGSESVVYISGFENVRSLLGFLGANKTLLLLENENIARSLRADASRAVNATESNIKKSLAAAGELYAAAKTIDEIMGLGSLPPHLKEFCRVVLEGKNLSLGELAAKLKIGKSGANHRARSIRQIFNTLK